MAGQKISFCFDRGDWTASNISHEHKVIEFDVVYKGQKQERIFIPMFGRYNVTNALAVYALAKTQGFQLNLKEAFSQFLGVKRRQELIGEPRGIQVFEDFAHHPTAVKATLESFKKRKSSGKLFAIFEPRSNTSRRNVFQKDYVQALKVSDKAFICEPTGLEKMAPELRMNVHDLSSDINKLGGDSEVFQQVEEVIKKLNSAFGIAQ